MSRHRALTRVLLGCLVSLPALAGGAARADEVATERQITAPGPQGALAGTLAGPSTPGVPVVLMIPGSGPVDRDGNSPSGGIKSADLRLLAEGLAARGIATARIDKRGLFGSAAAVADPNKVTINDYADDARAWIAALRRQTGARCVWVLGHSEGGLVALATAARDASGICGLVLVSTPGRPAADVLREQLHAAPGTSPYLVQIDAAIDALLAGRHVDVANMPAGLAHLFAPQIQDYLIALFRFDPAKAIAGIGVPVLIEQGDRDLQVGVGDAQALAAAAPAARLVLLPDTNHVLKVVTEDGRGPNIATYFNPGLPLAPGVVPAIADFIAAHPTGG